MIFPLVYLCSILLYCVFTRVRYVKLVQGVFILLRWVTSLTSRRAFLVACRIRNHNLKIDVFVIANEIRLID